MEGWLPIFGLDIYFKSVYLTVTEAGFVSGDITFTCKFPLHDALSSHACSPITGARHLFDPHLWITRSLPAPYICYRAGPMLCSGANAGAQRTSLTRSVSPVAFLPPCSWPSRWCRCQGYVITCSYGSTGESSVCRLQLRLYRCCVSLNNFISGICRHVICTPPVPPSIHASLPQPRGH